MAVVEGFGAIVTSKPTFNGTISFERHGVSTSMTENPTKSNITPSRTPDQRTNKRSYGYLLRSGAAGGLAGCAAKTLVAPLDRVKILFQTSNPQYAKYSGSWLGFATALRGIYSTDGITGLFRGHSATLLRIFPYAGIKFLAYEQARSFIIPNAQYETHARRFISGAAAGVISVACTYPLELVRVRLAFETKKMSEQVGSGSATRARTSLRQICSKIYHENPRISLPGTLAKGTGTNLTEIPVKTVPLAGIANFFRGFTATLAGMVPYAGCSFLVHDSASDLLRHPSIFAYTTIPHSSKTITTTPTSTSTSSSSSSFSSESESESSIYKPAQLRTWAELTAGGLAGLLSQTISYPLEVVRRRMQVGAVVGDGHRLKMAEVVRRIWMERGARGFFVGLGVGYLKIVPMTATSFWVYERGKWWLAI